jgi:hypothetical protein
MAGDAGPTTHSVVEISNTAAITSDYTNSIYSQYLGLYRQEKLDGTGYCRIQNMDRKRDHDICCAARKISMETVLIFSSNDILYGLLV